MIWLDITDPKYVLFFKEMIPSLSKFSPPLITTRAGEGYSECHNLLNLFGIEAHKIGSYGGNTKLGKLQARMQRQEGFLKLFESKGEIPKLFITGASVEGVQCAYGLGIPVVNFADTPIAGHSFDLDLITILSRLTLPLSDLVFRPFVVPSECYEAMGLKRENILSYDFIDVALWLKNLRAGEDFRKKINANLSLPTILVREEEYKAHYVKEKLPIIYESIALLSENIEANIVIMPRYDSLELKERFLGRKNVYILEEKLEPREFYPYIDLLIGGGGTMNLESCYLGIPTISTRSLLLFHDMYLIENGLMIHTKTPQEVLSHAQKILNSFNPHKNRQIPNFQTSLFERENAGFERIITQIKQRYKL